MIRDSNSSASESHKVRRDMVPVIFAGRQTAYRLTIPCQFVRIVIVGF